MWGWAVCVRYPFTETVLSRVLNRTEMPPSEEANTFVDWYYEARHAHALENLLHVFGRNEASLVVCLCGC